MRQALKEQLANEIAEQPDHPYVGWYAQQVFIDGASSEAITLLDTCLAQNATHQDALLVYGIIKVELDELDAAKEKLLELIAIEPRSFEALNILMIISLKEGAISRARELYALMTTIDPWFKVEIPDSDQTEVQIEPEEHLNNPKVNAEILGVSPEEELLDIEGSDIDAAIDGLFDDDDESLISEEKMEKSLFEKENSKRDIIEVDITGNNLGDVLDVASIEEEKEEISEEWVQPVSSDELESSLDDLFGDFDPGEDVHFEPVQEVSKTKIESCVIEGSDVENALDSLFSVDDESELVVDIEAESESSSLFEMEFPSENEEEFIQLETLEEQKVLDDEFNAPLEEEQSNLEVSEVNKMNDDIFAFSAEDNLELSEDINISSNHAIDELGNVSDSLFETDEEEIEEIEDHNTLRPVSTTLAEIYFNQQAYTKALGIYETLFNSDPDNSSIKERIEEIKTKMAESAEEQ